MRTYNKDNWQNFTPFTNVLVSMVVLNRLRLYNLTDHSLQWLHYLVIQLLNGFSLRRPVAPKRTVSATSNGPTGFTERDCWECLSEVEKVLGRAVQDAVGDKETSKRRRKTAAKCVETAPSATRHEILTAASVLGWGEEQGWIF